MAVSQTNAWMNGKSRNDMVCFFHILRDELKSRAFRNTVEMRIRFSWDDVRAESTNYKQFDLNWLFIMFSDNEK